jgi:hypothetical protein
MTPRNHLLWVLFLIGTLSAIPTKSVGQTHVQELNGGGGGVSGGAYRGVQTIGGSFTVNRQTTGNYAVYSPLMNIVQAPGLAVEVVTNTWIAANDFSLDGKEIVVRGSNTLSIAGEHAFQSLTVQQGGVVTHEPTNKFKLTISGMLKVEAGGRIDVTGKGYPGGRANGSPETGWTRGSNGLATTVGGATERSGGSHASLGGGPKPNEPYGEPLQTLNFGSGGATVRSFDFSFAGGDGGGIIDITAAQMHIDGEIRADGGNARELGGGGSGGTILLRVGQGRFMQGTGVVSVAGGNAAGADAGRGGNGRIMVWGGPPQFTNFVGYGSIYVRSLASLDPFSGFITLDSSDWTNIAEVVLERLSVNGTNRVVLHNRGTLVFNALTGFEVPPNLTLIQDGFLRGYTHPTLTRFILPEGATLSHSAGESLFVHAFEVRLQGKVDLRGKGLPGGVNFTGREKGYTYDASTNVTQVSGAAERSGGSYGSFGGGAKANPIYGNPFWPDLLGSGGSTTYSDLPLRGGAGGGRAHIRAASVLELSGEILADGGEPFGAGAGGSGGSILIETRQLLPGTGRGLISVKGSSGTPGFEKGGDGRVAIYLEGEEFPRQLPFQISDAGSIYLSSPTEAKLLLDHSEATIHTNDVWRVSQISSGPRGASVVNNGSILSPGQDLMFSGPLKLEHNGRFYTTNRYDQRLRHLFLQQGAVLTHSPLGGLKLALAGSLQVSAGSKIDVSGRGYPGGNEYSPQGRTRGTNDEATTVGGANDKSGGSYGTLGGGTAPNSVYGNPEEPFDLGSGGSTVRSDLSIYGGAGGGRVRIIATDLKLDGEILAEGSSGYIGAGGSGGSIWISLANGTLSGSGRLSISGGLGTNDFGSGGLGRALIEGFITNSLSGQIPPGSLGRRGTPENRLLNISGATTTGLNQLKLEYPSSGNYVLERSDNLSSWAPVQTPPIQSGAKLQQVIPLNSTKSFYRIRAVE